VADRIVAQFLHGSVGWWVYLGNPYGGLDRREIAVNVSLAGGYSLWTMLAVAAVAMTLAGVFYARTFRMLPPSQWRILFLLRCAAIFLVVLLLFRPVLSFYRELEEKPALIFLVDRSRSMSIADSPGGLTRFDQARQLLQSWAPLLTEHFELQLISFADRAQWHKTWNEVVNLSPDGEATSLSRALDGSRQVATRGPIEAAILLSDGIHNAAGNPQEAALRVSFPVHTIGVGASLRSEASFRDIQLTSLDCPERLLLGNKAQVKVGVEAFGLAGRVVQVTLEEEGNRLDQQELVLDDLPGVQEVTFEFIPAVKGRRAFRVSIAPVPEEKITQNNERTAIVLVVEPGIRVLYLEGTLRAEYGAIVERFLSKDPDIQFCALVRTKGNQFMRRSNIEGLELDLIPRSKEQYDRFDVFILGDLHSSFFRNEDQQLLLDRVREGAGLVMLGGYNTLGPGGYGSTPLGEATPVELGSEDQGQVTEPFLPQLTPEGAHHSIFANIADFFPRSGEGPRVGGLPPLSGCTRVGPPRPTASVLAVCPLEGDLPVLAVHPWGKGRIAVFTGDTTRNWQQGPKVLDQKSPFIQFWGQLVRYLAGRAQEIKAEATVVASTDKAYYEPGETITISAVVRDAQGQGTDKARVQAVVKGPGGRQEQLELGVMPGAAGHYSVPFEPRASGTYEIQVKAILEEQELQADPLAVEVGRPNLEYEKLDLDEKLLTTIASTTGGRYFHITAASGLLQQFNRAARKKRVYTEQPLYSPFWLWTAFVGLLTTEWILRRRFQLR
jgi:uncharacterized membrane protein